MPFEFKRSQNYLDRQAYYQAYKQFVCNGGKVPLVPATLTKQQVKLIQAKVARLYTQ